MVTKHPSLFPAIACASGILLASWFPVDWKLGFVATAILAALAFLLKTRRTLFSIACWFFLGASLFSFRYDIRDPTDLREMFSGQPELVTISGTLSEDPEHRVLEQDRRTRYRTTARVTVRELKRAGIWQAASGDVAVSTTGFTADDVLAGTEVEIDGVLSRPQGQIAPGVFDFERYLKWQRIFFVLRAESTNDWKITRKAEGWSAAGVYRRFNNWAMHTLQRGIPEDEDTRLLWAMVLGWKPGLTNEISEPFMRTGTLHIFAISGLHIAMIAAILVNVLRWFRLSRNWAGAIAIPIIWFYTGTTGWQASAIRSTIMSSVIIFGWMLKRPNNLLNSLAASAILIFLWQPEQLFQPGFQLSFILLLSFAVWPSMSPNAPWPDPWIYLGHAEPEEFARKPKVNAWNRAMARVFQWMTERDPMLPDELRPKWRLWSDHAAIWLLGGVNISLASLVGSLPVIAYYFNLISYSSLVANLIIVPASGIALGSSMASLVLSWIPFASEIANRISWETMRFMVWFCRALEQFHWTYEYVVAPGAAVIIAYYTGLLSLLKGRVRIAVAAGAVVIAIPLWFEATITTVTLLPGSGVVYVDAPLSKNDLLIDCGRDRDVAMLIKPFLHSHGVDRLRGIVLTHGDISHVEGYARLAKEFDPVVTYTSAARSRSRVYRDIVKSLRSETNRWRVVAAGDQIAGWRVLHPKEGEDFARADDDAVVLATTIEGGRIALLSDLGRLGQQSLLNAAGDLKCDVVFAGAPNDGQALRPELMEAMEPKVIAIAGNDAKAQRVLKDVRARATNVNVIATMDERAVTITARRGKVAVETMSGKRFDLR
jgi:ComEC/Rec2-related protein